MDTTLFGEKLQRSTAGEILVYFARKSKDWRGCPASLDLFTFFQKFYSCCTRRKQSGASGKVTVFVVLVPPEFTPVKRVVNPLDRLVELRME